MRRVPDNHREGSDEAPRVIAGFGVAGVIAGLGIAALLLSSCSTDKLRLGTPRSGDSWRMFGGGPQRANLATVPVVPPLVRAWEYDAGSGFGPASVSVMEGTLFVGTLKGDLRAIDLATGKETGSVEFDGPVFGTPLLLGSRIVVGLSGAGKNLVCRNLRTGAEDWSVETGDIESSPLSVGGMIIAATLDGVVAAYDTTLGKELWAYVLQPSPGRHGIRSSPSSDGAVVVVGTDGGDIIALDLATGRQRWKAAARGAIFAPTSIGGDRVFACSLDGNVYAIDIGTGAVIWTFDTGFPLYGGAAVGREMIVAGTSGGGLVALSRSDGSILWRARTDAGVGSAPAIVGAFVYVGDLERNLYAIDAATGAEVWREKLDSRVRTTPVSADGWLVVLAEDRSVICFTQAPR